MLLDVFKGWMIRIMLRGIISCKWLINRLGLTGMFS